MSQNTLLKKILNNPLGFIHNPDISGFSDKEFKDTLTYFNTKEIDRLTYYVCTRLFDRYEIEIKKQVYLWTQKNHYTCFPFIYKNRNTKDENIDSIKKYLIDFWNKENSKIFIRQNGPIEIKKQKKIGKFYMFLCNTKDNSFIVAYDTNGHGFYSINSRIRCYSMEYSFIEEINPVDMPIDLNIFNSKETKNIVIVFDHHIGDSLSLLSTQVPYLLKRKDIHLTLDISRCRFFANDIGFLKKITGGNKNLTISNTMPNYNKFDLISDPYDIIPGYFHKKIPNNSSDLSILSALHFAKSKVDMVRRDILDIHMDMLRYFGVVDKYKKQFIRYEGENKEVNKKKAIIFPFGLTDDRHYPTSRLGKIVDYLLKKGFLVTIGGSEDDIKRIYSSIIKTKNPSSKKISLLAGKEAAKVSKAISSSGLVISMDTGPLHIARMLRKKPIALYNEKVLDHERMMSFPWYVDDGTVKVLHPRKEDCHVATEDVIDAIKVLYAIITPCKKRRK